MTMNVETNNEQTKLFIVEQELKFARSLSGNDPAKRNRVLKNLKKWLKTRANSSHAFSDEDFLRLWKGLFYCMWMSDKPLVQEKLSEQLASLVHLFDDPKVSLQFFKAFLKTMCLEWFGIDQWRIDKFMMLIRRFIRQAFFVLKNRGWDKELVAFFVTVMESTVLDIESPPLCSLTMHFNDVILEELAKVAEGELKAETTHQFIQMYVTFLTRTDDYRLSSNIKKSIFDHLLYQSDLGQEYQEKYEIWKKAGFPTENIDDLDVEVQYENESDEMSDSGNGSDEEDKVVKTKKKIKSTIKIDQDSDDDSGEDEISEKIYDIRAGRVNVVLNEIKFDANEVVAMFNNIKFARFSNRKSKRLMKEIMTNYKNFGNDIFPIGYTSMPKLDESTESKNLEDPDLCALEMEEFERNLLERSTKLSIKQKRRLAKIHEEEKRLMESMEIDEQVAAKKRKITDDVDDKNNAIDKSSSDSLSQFVKDKSLSKTKSPKAKKALEQWTEEEIDDDIQLSQESSSSEDDEDSGNLTPVSLLKSVEQPEITIKAKKRHSLPASTTNGQNDVFSTNDEWSQPLKSGETEYFVQSRKMKLKEVNENDETAVQEGATVNSNKKRKLLKNPFAAVVTTPQNKLLGKLKGAATPITSAEKRVKIMLDKNVSQNRAEYIKQLKSSPQIPFDPTKKPIKGLLKPGAIPSPINPFYKRKLKLNLNDTL